ncbi:MAG: 6-carboxytetrahydropterin synthase [Gammaproteobacteria bacterium]|nr:6-carboxytetrahydropterin synthase [Gammaproteobacteria bacterium]MCH9743311.1 6-carboxytetrahydropterin synthase [Gammaproteobacteria bacterium]
MDIVKQQISRSFDLDVGHRVMDQRFKCSSLHGHRFRFEISFEFSQQQAIGYPIDFAEIKRLFGGWLDDNLDHGFIVNPEDRDVIKVCESTQSKCYLMSLNGAGQYCNPTAENICQEVFLTAEILFSNFDIITLTSLRLFETPGCCVEVFANSVDPKRREHFLASRENELIAYRERAGQLEYDRRKL